MTDRSRSSILWFDEITIDDLPFVGGKNASLGEMYRNLSDEGIRIPYGFAVTSFAYRYVLEKSGVLPALEKVLTECDLKDLSKLQKAAKEAREIIFNTEIPPEIQKEISEAYNKLSRKYHSEEIDVAVRSSATAEDLPDASFAGQQETFLNIKGVEQLLNACKHCFASLFTDRAIVYRAERNLDHFKVYLSIVVQKMIRSDLASSGVIFTLDTESGFSDLVLISGSYGLGESIVQGMVNSDEFRVFKPTLKTGYQSLIDKKLGDKLTKMICTTDKQRPTQTVDTPVTDRHRFCLKDDEVLQLAKWAMVIENHYSKKKGSWTPMDLEWAKDGMTGELFIVQARPETVQSRKNRNFVDTYHLKKRGKVLAAGKSVGSKISSGPSRVIADISDINLFKPGEVLITDMTDPNWVPIMRTAAAIVTNRGGRTSHAAIVSRELGLPCVVGTGNATRIIQPGENITVSCAEGDRGFIYEGLLDYSIEKLNIETIPKTNTKIMMNAGNPDEAFKLSFLPNDGVGLAREEFIVNEYIKIHPMALIKFDEVKDQKIRDEIEELTYGYNDKAEFFVDKLAMGIGIITAAFYPKDVILRFSDFKTNEYTNLIGGKYFEPKEENPMLGWRGASRYYKEGYKEAFALECKAIRKIRDVFGLKNLKVMIPMCRTPEEGRKVLSEMQENGLIQGKDGLEVYVMCEIPSNVILAEEFCDIFDGFSIGSNDLTQLTLGVDRDSAWVSDIYDERSGAVKLLIQHAVTIAKKRNRKIGICGDAPSTYPEFAEFLVDIGIDSISLSPDAILKTRLIVANREKNKRSI